MHQEIIKGAFELLTELIGLLLGLGIKAREISEHCASEIERLDKKRAEDFAEENARLTEALKKNEGGN